MAKKAAKAAKTTKKPVAKVFTKGKGKGKTTSPVLMMKLGEVLPMSIARWRKLGWDAPEDLDAYNVNLQTVTLA
jgi:ATP:corrinoid adenosyltransferase